MAPRFRHLSNLVGRDAEIQQLQDAYHRVRESPSSCEVVLLHGESGAGKTALVNQAFRSQRESGTMISGKFDIIHSTRPYSAIVDALTELCQPKTWSNLSNGNELLTKLPEWLGAGDVKILSHLVPAIEHRFQMLTFGSDPLLSVDSTFAFARLAEAVRTFMYMVAQDLPSPLVLFLDDVQAADQESLSIISSLTSLHSESQNLLLILAYRDQAEGPQLKRSSVLSHTSVFQVTDIAVGNLDVECGNKLVAMLLGMDPEETYSLSCLIAERTGGNTYFTLQFLEMLKDEKLLVYCFERCQWKWNLERIRVDTNVTDNVAMLSTSKIQQLPPDVQSALQLAACLGFYFDIEFLERIAMQERAGNVVAITECHLNTLGRSSLVPSPESLAPDSERHGVFSTKCEPESAQFCYAIAKAVEENLIDAAGGTKYKFTHDRVLYASYEMIPAGNVRDMLHWRIGEVLFSELQRQQHEHDKEQSLLEVADDWLLFAAADQLNRGASSCTFSTDGITPHVLARLNLDAGKASYEKSAFKHAVGFFDKGVNLVKGMWQSEYSLCLELYTQSAEAEYAASNFEKCDEQINVIFQNGCCLADMLPAYLIKIRSQGVRGRIATAVDESVAVLRRLGERIPRHPNLLHMVVELSKTKKGLKGKKIVDLASLPSMTCPLKIWAVNVLKNLVLFSWFARHDELFVVASCRMMQLTIKYGISSQGPFALASYGILLGNLGDLETANEVGKVALELTKKPHSVLSYASTVAIVSNFLHHLKQPLTRSLDLLMDGYNTGIKVGDIEGAAMCLCAYVILGAYLGKKLDVVLSEIKGFRQAFRDECDRNFAVIHMTPWHQLVLNLTGQSENPSKLAGAVLCEESYLAEACRTGNEMAIVPLIVVRMIVQFLFGDIEGASNEVSKLGMHTTKGTHFKIPFLLMYGGLIMLGMARKTRKRKYLRQANVFKRIMEKFVKAGNLNMPPILQLMLAEQASLRPRCRPDDVKKAYESAVKVAAQSGFSVVEAIGYERAGEYMLSIGDDFWAKTYLTRSLLLFDEWGATAKTNQMMEKHVFLARSDCVPRHGISLTLRKRYSFKESNERLRMSLAVN